jgi:hypothetical protein
MMIGTHSRRWTFAIGLLGAGAAIGCNDDGSWGEGVETEVGEVVYGADNRVEWSAAASNLRRVGDSSAIIANSAALGCGTSSCSILTAVPVAEDPGPDGKFGTADDRGVVAGLCPGEKFGPPTGIVGQGTMLNGYCSSFLVGADLMLTAGHCFDGANGSLPAAQLLCANMKVVFDFKADATGNTPLTFPASKVRSCRTVLGIADSGDDDWAVFRLDAPVTDRAPLAIRRSRKVANRAPIALAGYPDALPLKISTPAAVKDNTAVNSFMVNMDSFHGNSGGPVFHRDTETVEGIVQSGASDYTFDYVTNPLGCLRVHTCPEGTGCPPPDLLKFEIATRAKRAAAFIPSLSPRTFDTTTMPATNNTYQTFAGDFDGDGYDDILWYRPGTGMDYIDWSNGVNKTFTGTEFPVNGTYQPIIGDFDGDGNSDIFWYGPGSTADFIDYGNGKARTFTGATDSVGGAYITASGDFDGDGVTDILWHAPGSDKPDYISWFIKGHNRLNGPRYVDQQFGVTATYRPVTGDFNGDGRDEIFWYRPGDDSDSVWYFDANRVRRTKNFSVGNDYQPISGDFDGDGFADIVWYGRGSLVDGITWGRANETFPIDSFPVGGTYVTASGDFNGDGATDISWYRPGTASDLIDWGRMKPPTP